MSEAIRFTEFLSRRLRAMGLRIDLQEGSIWARGRLELSASPFETLGDPIQIRQAVFYTLGHSRLKFFQPRVLFDLPAVEIATCETAAEIERALRREWQKCHRDLASAHRWLSRFAGSVEVAGHGTRLRWVPASGAAIRYEVRSPDEIQLPTAEPLAGVRRPNDRRFRPLRGIESAGELDAALARAMREAVSRRGALGRRARAEHRPVPATRLLVLSDDDQLLTALEAAVVERDLQLEYHRDREAALAAFHLRSFDAVLLETRLGRAEGLEIALRLREVPGIEDLPMALLDTRHAPANRQAAARLGVHGYVVKPLTAADLARLLDELLERVSRRRFRRFSARFAVRAAGAREEDRTELIARGGICLRSTRALSVGQEESYALALPPPYAPARARGHVVSRANVPGSATVLAGVRFKGFEADDEASWLRLIETLAGHDKTESRD